MKSRYFSSLGLNDLWNKFTKEEQKYLIDGYKSVGLNIIWSKHLRNDTQIRWLTNNFLWFKNKRFDEANLKIIDYVKSNNLYANESLENKHYYLIQLIDFYYKPRTPEIHNPEKVKKLSYMDLDIFINNIDLFTSVGNIATTPAFDKLIKVLEKEKNYEEAIRICELAIKYKQRPSLENKLIKLKNKL